MQSESGLDIEVALKEDTTGEYKKTLMDELQNEAVAIKQYLNKGVGTDEFKKLNGLLQATEAASTVVETVWQQTHVH